MSSSKKPPGTFSSPLRPSTSTASNSFSTTSPRRPSQTPLNSQPNTPSRTHSGSPISARSAVSRPPRPTSTLFSSNDSSSFAAAEDQTSLLASTIADLKAQLSNSSSENTHLTRQLSLTNTRLDSALSSQTLLEEQLHALTQSLEALQAEHRESSKQRRELQRQLEIERSHHERSLTTAQAREAELSTINARLKDKLSTRFADDGAVAEQRLSRSLILSESSSSSSIGNFAPLETPPEPPRKNSDSNPAEVSELLANLRLDLATSQIALIESQNLATTRLQQTESLLLTARMDNARLVEDNESFQLLLSEKTLSGEFTSNARLMRRSLSPPATIREEDEGAGLRAGGSLADELSAATGHSSDNHTATVGASDNNRRLEKELRSAKDQNKALTLYISNIIERLLNHKDFEAILDKTPGLLSAPSAANSKLPETEKEKEKEKSLPPLPEASGESVLQRAKTVAERGGAGRRPRPMSYMQSATSNMLNEDGLTMARMAPLGRSHSVRLSSSTGFGAHNRTNSMDLATNPTSSATHGHPAATVVGQMFRPSGGSGGAAGSRSPPLSSITGMQHSRQPSNFFSPGRPPTGSSSPDVGSEPSSVVGASSPPPKGLRTLRLVQENSDETDDNNKTSTANKRGSWMGWFNKGKDETPTGSTLGKEIYRE